MTKVCRDCGEEKTLSTEFFERRSDNGLYRHTCLSCLRAKQRDAYTKRHYDAIEAKAKKISKEDSLFSSGKFKCQKCNQVQHLTAFRKHKQARLGIETTCKSCKEHMKEERIVKSGTLRKCRTCGDEAKNVEQLELFVKDTKSKFGRYNICKKCHTSSDSARYHNNSLEKRCKKFGITIDEYNNFVSIQNNSCAICKKHKDDFSGRGNNFHIDHCHTSGKVRGLLCSNCNTGLGQFKDDIKSLESAIQYLKLNV
jgi:hypothetical protein